MWAINPETIALLNHLGPEISKTDMTIMSTVAIVCGNCGLIRLHFADALFRE